MSDGKQKPIGRITVKNSATGEYIQVGAIWPNRGKGKSLGSISLGGRNQVDGQWVDCPAKLSIKVGDQVHTVTTGKGSGFFVDLFLDEGAAKSDDSAGSGSGEW